MSAPRGVRFWPLPPHLSNRMGQWAGSRVPHTTKGFLGLPMGTAWTPRHSDTHSPGPGGCAHSSTWDPSPWSAYKTDTSSCICWAVTGHQTARSALYSTCDPGVVSVPSYRGGNSGPERLYLATASQEVAGTLDHSLLERRVGPQEALGQRSGRPQD